MRNWEKYEEEIKAIGIDDFAITEDGKVNECLLMNCSECEFQRLRRKCNEVRVIWLYKEYEEPEVDWSKVPVDTPIYVTNNEDRLWSPRYFAKYEDEKIYVFTDRRTSFSKNGMFETYRYAELAENFITIGERVLDE